MSHDSSSPPRVLVVDDHHDGGETLGDFLQLLGCDVRLTQRGEDALALAPTFRPHLVILDIDMPGGISGLETARRLRRQPWAQRSVFATHSGSSDPAIADLSRGAGCQHHIAKPAQQGVFEALVDAVRAARTDCH